MAVECQTSRCHPAGLAVDPVGHQVVVVVCRQMALAVIVKIRLLWGARARLQRTPTMLNNFTLSSSSYTPRTLEAKVVWEVVRAAPGGRVGAPFRPTLGEGRRRPK